MAVVDSYAGGDAEAIKAGTPSSNGWEERLMTSHTGSTTSIQTEAACVFIAVEVSKRDWL
jgi:hypothetical protein